MRNVRKTEREEEEEKGRDREVSKRMDERVRESRFISLKTGKHH